MTPEQIQRITEALERIAQANETIALMLQVLLEDASGTPDGNSPQVIMTQAGPVQLG